MLAENLELSLMAHALDGHYRETLLPRPTQVDWKRLERLVIRNKLQLLVFDQILQDPTLALPDTWRVRFREALDDQIDEQKKLGPSMFQIKEILGQTPYVVVKTFRPFPYFSHDIDVLVEDTAAVGNRLTQAALEWTDIPKGSAVVEDPRWLDLEFYGRVLPGSIKVIDDELTLKNPVPAVLGGEDTWVASPDIEIVTLIADAIFRLYELKLGDMVYIYSLAAQADWDLLQAQAAKYGWHEFFVHIVGVLNSYHHELFGSPSPIEQHVPGTSRILADAPYVSGWASTTRALARKGKRHLIKLPAYLSVRLKQNHPRLHRAYVKFFQVPVSRVVMRYVYH